MAAALRSAEPAADAAEGGEDEDGEILEEGELIEYAENADNVADAHLSSVQVLV